MKRVTAAGERMMLKRVPWLDWGEQPISGDMRPLPRLIRDGYVQEKRYTRPMEGTPITLVTIYWSLTDAGRAYLRSKGWIA